MNPRTATDRCGADTLVCGAETRLGACGLLERLPSVAPDVGFIPDLVIVALGVSGARDRSVCATFACGHHNDPAGLILTPMPLDEVLR